MFTMFTLLALSLGLGFYLGKVLLHRGKGKPRPYQDGEVFVNGSGHIAVRIVSVREPRHITVNFSDNVRSHPCHPCNPSQDTFNWEMVKDGESCYLLNIYFSVSSIREIVYRIEY